MSIQVKNIEKHFGAFHALKDISLDFPEGQLVALLGPSGCGKTTLLHVLLGVFRQNAGDISIMGRDMEKLGLNAVRDQIATVLQDDILFAGSIAENICFFDSNPNQEWMQQCADLAAIHQDIIKMQYKNIFLIL